MHVSLFCKPLCFVRRAVIVVSAALPCCPALAQHKPYEPLAVTYDMSAQSDTDLHALIETLRAAVAQKNLAALDAALAPTLMVYECDADPVKPCPDLPLAAAATPGTLAPGLPAPSATASVKVTGLAKPVRASKAAALQTRARLAAMLKLPPAQRLRAGLCCRDVPAQHITKAMREEAVLGFVGATLEDETLGAHPDLPGAVCMPAWPAFDRAKAAQIAANADIENANLRAATAELVLRDKPEKDAAEVARIGKGAAVAFVTDAAAALPDGWSAVALAAGGLGYTDQGGLADLTPAGLCFAKDGAGVWKISAAVQRHS